MQDIKLELKWNAHELHKHFGINKFSGCQNMNSYINISINKKIPVLKVIGKEIGVQVMTLDAFTEKSMETKKQRCIIIANSIKIGKNHIFPYKYFFVSGTYIRPEIKKCTYQYICTIDVVRLHKGVTIAGKENTSGIYIPAILSYDNARKYITKNQSLNDLLASQNINNLIKNFV